MSTRVLYAIDSMHGGGAETSLIEMAPSLQRRGISMSVVTLLDDDNALSARMAQAGIPAHRVRARTWLGLVRGLSTVLRADKPDILHTSLLRSDVCGRTAALGTDLPVVTSLVNSS